MHSPTPFPVAGRFAARALVLAAAALAGSGVQAQNLVISEDFTGTSASQDWTVFDGACLTAGDGSGDIPACSGNAYYSGVTLKGGKTGTLPDPSGSGALRFTNNSNYQTGAILSNFSFPSGSGIAITFSTVTYGGTGADGIGFFLIDGSKSPTAVGGSGGSLGYSCSNTNGKYDGLAGAYMGLGMDEFGNFLNAGDNTSTGDGFQAGRIGLRGAGDISWATLLANYSGYYSNMGNTDANKMTAVKKTCSTGYLWDYSSSRSSPTKRAQIPYAYNLISGSQVTLPSTTPLYTSATTRPAAKPVSYQLKITKDNLLSLSYSYNGGVYQSVLTDQSIADANGTLPSTLKFGFSGSTGGSNNIHEVMCFKAAPATKSSSGAGINVQQATEVRTGTQVYLAGYNPNNWFGQFTSQNLLYNTSTNTVSVAGNANWDASCVLTGGACTTMSSTATVTVQAPTARTMLTWGTTGGIPFAYSSLSSAQQAVINAGDSSSNANRVNYLRGDRTNEGATSGKFRTRDSVLGDIIDSGPAWVGPPSAPYGDTWTDGINGVATLPENASTAQKYSAFITANKARMNVVYTGSNDGFVHGFRTGSYDASGNYITSAYPNDGKEVLAYMPSTVFANIHSTTGTLDYANRLYSHAYQVNATPYSGDLFYAGAWHTWLVGGLGAGGAGIYALDVTDPSSTVFAESNAANLVKADLTPSTLSCVGDTSCGTNLGSVYGQPQIRRFHNGMWGYVFGNGFNSATGKAGIFVVTVDPVTGAQLKYFLSTGSGTTSAKNGIANVSPADIDGDHTIDYVYAGDINGNVWRFDLTGALPSTWAVSTYGTSVATPLFASGLPITTKVVVAIVPANSGNPRVMVDFGTGYKTAQTASSAATFTAGSHRFYGIWDWDMGTATSGTTTGSGWNLRAGAGNQRASLTGSTNSVVAANLTVQTITALSSTQRTVSSVTVCWKGSTDCGAAASANTKFGWYIQFPTTSEQVIYSPSLYNAQLLITSTIPAASNVLNCNDDSTDTGWLLAVSPASGGSFKQSSFSDANGNFTNVTVSNASYVVSGIATDIVGSLRMVTAGGSTFYVGEGANGAPKTGRLNDIGANIGARVTWQQIR